MNRKSSGRKLLYRLMDDPVRCVRRQKGMLFTFEIKFSYFKFVNIGHCLTVIATD